MSIQSSEEPRAFQNFEHQGWQVVAPGYQKHFNRLTSQVAPAIMKAAGVGAGIRVLDVCTGPGMLAAAAVKRGADVVGIDLSSIMLDLARENAPQAIFEEGDAQALPFESESFDAVVCGLGVIHVPEPARAFSEILRVLKPGGYAAISTWGAPTPQNGFGLVLQAIKTHGNLDVSLPHGPDMFQFSEDHAMRAAFSETGFQDIDVETVNLTWIHDEPGGVMTALVEGSVRTRALLEAQTEQQRISIFEAARSAVSQYSVDGSCRVPMTILIGQGSKPDAASKPQSQMQF